MSLEERVKRLEKALEASEKARAELGSLLEQTEKSRQVLLLTMSQMSVSDIEDKLKKSTVYALCADCKKIGMKYSFVRCGCDHSSCVYLHSWCVQVGKHGIISAKFEDDYFVKSRLVIQCEKCKDLDAPPSSVKFAYFERDWPYDLAGAEIEEDQ